MGKFVAYENDAVSPQLLQAIHEAASAALREAPVVQIRDEVLHPSWVDLECTGSLAGRLQHDALRDFAYAPPAMRKLAALMNGLLPSKERIRLVPYDTVNEKYPGGAVLKREMDNRAAASTDAPPKWTALVRLEWAESDPKRRTVYVARIAANGIAKVVAGDEVLYENDSLASEDLGILLAGVEKACQEEPQSGDGAGGLSVRIELLDPAGAVVKQHHDDRLPSFGKASPGTARAPLDQRSSEQIEPR